MFRKTAKENAPVASTESSTAAAPAKNPRTTRVKSTTSTARKPKAAVAVAEETAISKLVEAVANPPVPSQEEIARLAYSYWLERDGSGGSPEEDWLRAEQELSARAAK
jgi:hypothetical protein